MNCRFGENFRIDAQHTPTTTARLDNELQRTSGAIPKIPYKLHFPNLVMPNTLLAGK